MLQVHKHSENANPLQYILMNFVYYVNKWFILKILPTYIIGSDLSNSENVL
jgi:hypothetical protein